MPACLTSNRTKQHIKLIIIISNGKLLNRWTSMMSSSHFSTTLFFVLVHLKYTKVPFPILYLYVFTPTHLNPCNMNMCASLPPDYMAHLVEVQHERGASGGHTFHSLLSASLAPRRGQCSQSLCCYRVGRLVVGGGFESQPSRILGLKVSRLPGGIH